MVSNVNVLNPMTCDLSEHTLIEASAGTGKTFTIAFLYVRLVLGHFGGNNNEAKDSGLSQGLLPKQILVVTFTEAATKELVDRIRLNLALAAEVFSDNPQIPASVNVDLLLELKHSFAPCEHSLCRKRLLDALELMDEASISTIHAWCYEMLSEHAFDSGSLFQIDLQTSQQPLLAQLSKDYWRQFIYPLRGAKLRFAYEALGSPEQMLSKVHASLNYTDYFEKPAAPFALFENMHSLRESFAEVDWQSVLAEVNDFLNEHPIVETLHKGQFVAPINKVLPLLEQWYQNDAIFPEKFAQKAPLKGYLNLSTERFLAAVNDQLAPLAICQHIDTLFEIAQLEKQASFPLLQHAAHVIAKGLEREQAARGELSFDGLLTQLNNALTGPKKSDSPLNTVLANTLLRQFPVALIDEFQDTDQTQFGIFEKIYLREAPDLAGTLLMIGDPKQAIYSFRGGDIYTYLNAADAVGDAKYTLATNYRSTHAMVSAVNHLFAEAEQRTGQAFNFTINDKNPLPFHPVQANGLSTDLYIDGEVPKSLMFWQHINVELDNKRKPWLVDRWRSDMALACAEQIVHILNLAQQGRAYFGAATINQGPDRSEDKKPVMPHDIAILVNDKTEAEAVKHALLSKNLKSVYLSTRGSVLASVLATDMLTWLKAIAQPTDISTLSAALGTATLHLDYAELKALRLDDYAMDNRVQQFLAYRQIWQFNGVLPCLRKLMLDFRVHETLASMDNGERAITDLLHLGEVLQQASLKLDGMENLIHYFEDAIEQESEYELEFNKPRLESDKDLIKIVTVHKSKGLQYPLVFLPYATKPSDVPNSQKVFRYHQNSEMIVSFDPDEAKPALARSLAQEDIRKLYVALTRAKYATWVGCANNKSWNNSGIAYLLGFSKVNDPLEQGLASLVEVYPNEFDISPLPRGSNEAFVGLQKKLIGVAREAKRELKQLWNSFSYSAIVYEHSHGSHTQRQRMTPDALTNDEQARLLENDESAVEDEKTSPSSNELSIHSFHRGARPGTFLHDVLEWICKQGFLAISQQPELLSQYLEKQINNSQWSEYASVLNHWMLGLITQPLALSNSAGTVPMRVSLKDLALSKAEMEFWFSCEQADLQVLDALVCKHTMDQAPRPKALASSTFAINSDAQDMTGVFKGFIDLSFEHDGKYYVLDYKSNHLGDDDNAYTQHNMESAILQHRYDLQFVIYIVALHRLLKSRILDYNYDKHIGGCIYYFLRGYRSDTNGIFATKPPKALIEEVDAVFSSGASASGSGEPK